MSIKFNAIRTIQAHDILVYIHSITRTSATRVEDYTCTARALVHARVGTCVCLRHYNAPQRPIDTPFASFVCNPQPLSDMCIATQ